MGAVLLAGLLTDVSAQGPFSAQIQRALTAFKATAQTFTAAMTTTITGLGTTSTDGEVIQNTTAATVGTTVQISPRSRWCGTAWDTAASETVCFFAEVLPATAATPTGTWKLGYSLNGAAATYPLTVASGPTNSAIFNGNNLTLASGGQIAGSLFTMYAAGAMTWVGQTRLTSPADAQLNITNAAITTAVGLDVATDAVLKIRTSAQTGYATLDALAYRASGTAITSGTTHLSAGSGMAVANVGANSCGTTTATIAGNNNAAVVTVGATAGTQCRIAFTVTATTEWDCAANDDTTTVAVRTTPVDSTHTDLIGTFTAGDKVTAICFPR